MSALLDIVNPQKTDYVDRRYRGTREQYFDVLAKSTTLYIGNLSFFTSEEQIHELFSRAGDVRRIIMGLDSVKKTPCGFCFVIYYTRKDAEAAVAYLNGTLLDERNIRVDFDWGFEEGRQFGRGKSGGQVRDEFRSDYDEGRGGYGRMMQSSLQATQQQVQALLGVNVSSQGAGAVYLDGRQRRQERRQEGGGGDADAADQGGGGGGGGGEAGGDEGAGPDDGGEAGPAGAEEAGQGGDEAMQEEADGLTPVRPGKRRRLEAPDAGEGEGRAEEGGDGAAAAQGEAGMAEGGAGGDEDEQADYGEAE